MDLRYGELFWYQACYMLDFFKQAIEVGLNGFVLPGDFCMAAAEPAQRIAKWDVRV